MYGCGIDDNVGIFIGTILAFGDGQLDGITRRKPPAPPKPPEPDPKYEPRVWKDSTGKFSINAVYGGIISGDVILKKANGEKVKVPLDRLSREYQKWLEEMRK